MRPKRWTDQEVAILKANLAVIGPTATAALLRGRTVEAVAAKAWAIENAEMLESTRRPPKYPRWTEAENQIVREYYPNVGIRGCMAKLPGRSRQSVKIRAQILGVVVLNGRAPVRPTQKDGAAPDEIDNDQIVRVHRPVGQWPRVDPRALPARFVFDLAQAMELEAA